LKEISPQEWDLLEEPQAFGWLFLNLIFVYNVFFKLGNPTASPPLDVGLFGLLAILFNFILGGFFNPVKPVNQSGKEKK